MFGDNNQPQDTQSSSMMPQDMGGDSLGMPQSDGSSTPAPTMNDMGSSMATGDSSTPSTSSASDTGRGTSTQMPDDLMSIKQDALQSLKPLVGHLDQSPEERFRTAMMMIQASDDQSLIPDAYEAAKAIEDEKTRAQALLDVVNEINYFTQAAKQQ